MHLVQVPRIIWSLASDIPHVIAPIPHQLLQGDYLEGKKHSWCEKDFNTLRAWGRQKRVQINTTNVINVIIRSGT